MFVTLTQFRMDQVASPEEQKILIRADRIMALWPRTQHYVASEDDRKKIVAARPIRQVVDVEYTNSSAESDGCVTVIENLAEIQGMIYWAIRDGEDALEKARHQARQ